MVYIPRRAYYIGGNTYTLVHMSNAVYIAVVYLSLLTKAW
jgi:hypothetical protein